MKELDIIRQVPGFENYEEPRPSRAFIKLLQGKAATTAKKVPGTIIRTDNNETVCEAGEELRFVPIYFDFRYVILDDDANIVDILRNGESKWESGREAQPEDIKWINGQPPKANKALDLVILPASELSKEEKVPAVLSIISTNAQRSKLVTELLHIMKVSTLENKLEGLFQGSYSLSVDTFTSGKHEWLDWCKPKFRTAIKKETFALCKDIYKSVKETFSSAPALEASSIEKLEEHKEEVKETPKKKPLKKLKEEAIEVQEEPKMEKLFEDPTPDSKKEKITVEVAEDLDF